MAKFFYFLFLVCVVCVALREYFDFNAMFELECYLRWGEVNFGIAVDILYGLFVLVVRRVGELTVDVFVGWIVEFVDGVCTCIFMVDDYCVGIFMIFNFGLVGVVLVMVIINQF